jgi:hypothetical protein
MKTHGSTSLAEFLGDRVVYRNLEPQDKRLPGLKQLTGKLGLPAEGIPRKAKAAYGAVIAEILKIAQQIDHPGSTIKNLVFIGDTRLNDGTSYQNICKAGSWQGVAFIGNETQAPVLIEQDAHFDLPLYTANRWSCLADFAEVCNQHGVNIQQDTAVIFDLDKTSLGARGRNDKAIDRARTQAGKDTISNILSDSFNESIFNESYQLFNQVSMHPFTTDNQDYLVYLCLLACVEFIKAEALVQFVSRGIWKDFKTFAETVNSQIKNLPPEIQPVQNDFYTSLQNGDPTPFKSFRRQEYCNTIAAMQNDSGIELSPENLENTIFITEEVRQFGLFCKDQGALLFGLSDKPDEASLPTEELAGQGYLPLHRSVMTTVSLT